LAQQRRHRTTDDVVELVERETMNPSAIMLLLQDKVPLTLLLDLSDADRLPSASILRREPADLTWLRIPPTASHTDVDRCSPPACGPGTD